MAAIFRFVSEPSSLQFVGAAAAAATSVTVPTHRAGDLLVVHAYRDGNTTAPSLPGGWTNIDSGGANTNSSRVGYLLATGSGTSSGTWTNATQVEVAVYRGVDPTTPIGASANASGSSSTVSVPAITLQKTDGTSWVLGMFGHRTASVAFPAPSGMTQRARVGTGPQSALNDTNGSVQTWPATNVAVGTSSGWRAVTVEVRGKPVTVLDINNGALTVKDGDFSLGAPEWTADPDTVNGDDGYREATMTVGVDNSYTDAAAAVSALSKVLQRPDGWFMFQRENQHRPMFLRWYRTPPEDLSWEHAYIDTYRLPVRLTCDPYIRGERRYLDPLVITNNPASGTNPAFVKFASTAFKGDAPTPLKIDLVPSGDWHGYQPLMATAALAPGLDQTAPIVWDLTAANFTAGTNVGADVADATFVGGSYRECTFGSAGMLTRLSGDAPTIPTPGTYKVLLRCATSTDTSTFALRFGQLYNVTQVRYGDTKTLVRPNTTITAYACWVDLGEFTFPFGAAGLDPADIGGVTAPDIEIQAQRVSGSANLRFDALLLIPVDTAATLDAVIRTDRFHGFGLEANRSGVWDGEKQRFLAYDFGINLANLRPPEPHGGYLRVTPGVVNICHLLQQTQIDTPVFTDLDDDDEIANTATITVSYLPRYLHMRPDTE